MADQQNHVVLLGDSTLDNVVWVKHYPPPENQCIKDLLVAAIPDSKITNYAADGFTSSHLVKGGPTGISYRAREETGDPFPHQGTFKPLELLPELGGTHAILSIGGNDIRVILGNMQKLPTQLGKFNRNFPVIIQKILEKIPKLVIMLQYRPCKETDGVYGVYSAMKSILQQDPVQTMHALMEVVYQPVFKIARDYNIPIIDLPNTFDINDAGLYEQQIEPSYRGGKIITSLIKHVVENHDWQGIPKFYSQKPDGEIIVKDHKPDVYWFVAPQKESILIKIGIVSMMTAAQAQIAKMEEQKAADAAASVQKYSQQIEQLKAMGFSDESAIQQALVKTEGSVERALQYLL